MDKKRAWFIAILFFSGLCLTLYPFVSNLIAQSHASQAIAAYDEQVAEMDQEQIDAAKEAVRKYNEQLNAAVEASAMQGEDGISYLDLVDVGESIGFIEIPKIDVYLPIYSGTGEDVLQKGVGHLAESSYPIGGTSTHSVLTGHRGLPSAVLFTDLDKMEEGDVFYLHVLDEVLAYKVDQIKVVLPTITKRIVDVWPWLVVSLLIVAGVEGSIFLLIVKRQRSYGDVREKRKKGKRSSRSCNKTRRRK